jgi:hypothetical protein
MSGMLRIYRFGLIVWLICAVFLLGFSQEENPTKVKVIVDSATIKVTPEIDGETLARIPLNTILDASEKQGEWYKVSFDKESLQITGFIHEMLVRVLSKDEMAEEGIASPAGTVESQAEIIRDIESRMEKSRQLIRQENKFEEAANSLNPLVAKTFRVEDLQKQRQLATEIFLWTGMAYSGMGDSYAALREIRNMFEVDYAYGKAITRNIYDPQIGGLIEQAEKEYLGVIKDYSLRISSRPEQARIIVSGEDIGRTPLIYRSESPKVLLEIKKDGYETVKDDIFLTTNKLCFALCLFWHSQGKSFQGELCRLGRDGGDSCWRGSHRDRCGSSRENICVFEEMGLSGICVFSAAHWAGRG